MLAPSPTLEPQTTDAAPKGRVLCAMSGGVDSSLAAALLKEAGYAVQGAMLRFWPDDRPKGAFDLCCSPDAAFDARRVADAIDVPFYLLDAREQFDEVVISPFVPTYEAGRTPNPCVWCNREIKFGTFLKKARRLGCDYIATGHYVRRVDGPGGVELHRGEDDTKDQTYFLWALERSILPHLLFPLGALSKTQVRELAEARGFATADKRSSHGLCFITTSVKDYLRDFSERRPGAVLDASDGFKKVGEHSGVQFYTIGQRRGLGLYHSHLERFVVDLRSETNEVIVGTREMCHWRGLRAEQANWLLDAAEVPERVLVQTRYRQRPVPASVRLSGSSFELRFDEPMFAVTLGQSAVLYHGTRLLGGGVITERLP
ncbi:tRNA 2-thiouridine(34) synthase MnmA [Truepera radiovictrix]|uniref:tRNA-specific 2-thiouridylase MnmA n=1 Tax=Truepera radiovictrix (strain DSM 17093 / CIP 108686 / LMG 22925 / RQ-24) TaxID=649638 RepID=D7CUB4_TRURR|nr:tRNA 2-thiouridine(34) synthase MnmA [Truepera radiovictrix]ADI15699.1 tRNA(5-methylaminomethyl-2-thiouridylate)-methyl transferase [Truepera radiovictrix DSM 17093]WMT58673.1 tRNA 2-thiouridine(34) synthase MnmA [Truepera radiovictrix]